MGIVVYLPTNLPLQNSTIHADKYTNPLDPMSDTPRQKTRWMPKNGGFEKGDPL